MMNETLARRQIVLLGIGHTNAHIVKMWRMNAISDTSLICVSNFPVATYSGMLPGVLSGQYAVEEMEIDLVRLCQACGARLIVDDVVDIDISQQTLLFKQRPPLRYDALSIGIGSMPNFDGVQIAENANLVRIKPMQTFLQRLDHALARYQHTTGPIRIVVVGGGVGGVEVTLCLGQNFKRQNMDVSVSIVHSGNMIGNGLSESTQRRIQNVFQSRNIAVHSNRKVVEVNDGCLVLDDRSEIQCDVAVWATGAQATPLLRKVDLAKDGNGFLLTDSTLQSISNKSVFVVGDSGTMKKSPVPKAGVYAVRQGPVLWDNLQKLLADTPLKKYKPQRTFLKLLNTGDGRAIGEYMGFSATSPLAWKWKDWIDKRFMKRFQDLEPAMGKTHNPDVQEKMRCVGCGGKIGGSILSSVLADLEIPAHPDVIVGVDSADDAAIVRTENQTLVTTDFFAAPLNDPWLMGRIAVLNAISDCYAMGAHPSAALANIQVPFGPSRRQQEIMLEVMSGAVDELKQSGTALVGGHSIEGPRLLIGFTVLATPPKKPLTKSGLQAGDELILSKSLGTGALLAAHMQAKCDWQWMSAMIESMLMSNRVALEIADRIDVHAMTDVTGFGLAGHLSEMLEQSNCSAKLTVDQIPLLNGFQQLHVLGVESTMADENRLLKTEVKHHDSLQNSTALAALFDPQTSGGLLIGCPSQDSRTVLSILHQNGFSSSAVIGRVTSKEQSCSIELA
jgi:selenide, water dikinase